MIAVQRKKRKELMKRRMRNYRFVVSILDEEYYQKSYEEVERSYLEVENASAHLDELFNCLDFVEFCADRIEALDAAFSAIEKMVGALNDAEDHGVDTNFGLGACWVAAVAAYEGHLHKIFLKTMSVRELRAPLINYCERRLREKKPPHRNMKLADIESVMVWLRVRTVTDPGKMADSFDEIFGIRTVRPSEEFCENLLSIRNAFCHRGGGDYTLEVDTVKKMISELNEFALRYTNDLAAKVAEVARPDA